MNLLEQYTYICVRTNNEEEIYGVKELTTGFEEEISLTNYLLVYIHTIFFLVLFIYLFILVQEFFI